MTIFQKGFKNNVKKELMYYNRIIDDLNNFMKTFIKLNNRLYELTMNLKHDEENSDRTEIYYEKFQNNHSSESHLDSKSALFNNYEVMSMKLNFMQHKEKNLRKKQKEKNDKTCYSCDRSGHFAKNCRSKNMMQ